MKPSRTYFFGKHGHPRRALVCALSITQCRDLEALELAVKMGDVTLHDILRARGNGNTLAPGKLAQYLFNVPSKEVAKMHRAILDMGAGI